MAAQQQMRLIFLEEVEPHETGHLVGAVFPDYELSGHTGTRRKLSDLELPGR
jgi:hypothetical protein